MTQQDYLWKVDRAKRLSFEYYVLNRPSVSDEVFDGLVAQIEQAEQEHPEWTVADSPTQQVGSDLNGNGRRTIRHRTPMLSCQKAQTDNKSTNREKLEKWLKATEKAIGHKNFNYCLEWKFDGISCSLVYLNGDLISAATRGDHFKGQDITKLSTAERVKLGIGVSFQTPPAIRGVSVRDLLKIESHQDMDDELNPRMQELAKQLKFSDEFLDRDVNLGFSGGEVKRSEILQLLAQMPDFTMFDEPDSGVDIENVELLASEIGTLLDKDKPQGSRKRSGLLITHLGYILNFVSADKAHVLIDGVISCSGNPTEILEDIRKNGFNGCVECAQCL